VPPRQPRRRNRTPVPRADSEQRLISATIQIAREEPYGELSARRISRLADVNHGYVHVWFGSKAGLIAAACDAHAKLLGPQLAAEPLSAATLRHPDVTLMFRLLGRLQAEPGGLELAERRTRPLQDLIAYQLRGRSGVSAVDAEALAELAVAAAAGIATVGDVLRLDIDRVISIWTRALATFANT
jgi:AcrR family transcriptional regulator